MAPLFRKTARVRSNKSSCQSYRKALWFRPRLERLENRILLSADNWIAGSGNWDVGSNWSLGAAPDSSDTTVINTSSAATITIQSGDTIQVQSVTTGSNDMLSITGGSLSLTGTLTNNGTLTLNPSSTQDANLQFSGNAILAGTGQLVMNAGSNGTKGGIPEQLRLRHSGFGEQYLRPTCR